VGFLHAGARHLAIRRYLAGQPFEPDVIREMSLALESVCAALGISVKDDAVNRHIATKIIEYAQSGVRDHTRLEAAVLRELGQQSS